MHFFLEAWLLLASASAVRQTLHGSAPCELSEKCDCWDAKVCSACSLATCGLEQVRSVQALEGGTNRLREDLPVAYVLEDTKGRRWALKLADQVNHSYNGAVEASQLAHRLGVVTPRVLQISLTSCPAAFQHEGLKEAVAEFQKQQKKWALLQEYVNPTQDLPCASNSSPFWVQVGRVAMFDWLTGRNDLFNDLEVGGIMALAENVNTNKDNILETASQAVEIDLGFSQPCCLDDFQKILEELGKRRVPWVRSHILTLMCEGKAGGLGMSTCSSAYGKYGTSGHPKGWHEEISRIQIELGMTELAEDALRLAGQQGWAKSSSGLSLLQQTWSLEMAAEVAAKLRSEEKAAVAALPQQSAGQKCCSVACQYQGRFWVWHKCGAPKALKTVNDNEDCEGKIKLNAVAQHLHCSSACPRGSKELSGKLVESQGNCPV